MTSDGRTRTTQSVPSFNERVGLLMTREGLSLAEAEARVEQEHAAPLPVVARSTATPVGVFCPTCGQSTLPSAMGVCLWCETPIGAAA